MNTAKLTGQFRRDLTEADAYTSFGTHGEYRLLVANTIEQRRKAWAMVHDAYARKQYIEPRSDGLWYGLHDALPSTTTFIVTHGDEVVAALTTVLDSPLGLPADEIYADELNTMRRNGRRLCEIISLVSEETNRRACMKSLQHIFRLAYLAARKVQDATDFIITVNPHHAAYYQQRLLFEQCGEERSYEKVGGAPAVLLNLDFETVPERYRAAHAARKNSAFMFFIDPEAEASLCPILMENMTPFTNSDLEMFFEERRPLLSRASEWARQYIRFQYDLESDLNSLQKPAEVLG